MQSCSPNRRRSIATQSLLAMSVRISMLICLTSALTYWHLHHVLHAGALEQLQKYIAERGPRESARFQLAASNHGRMRAELTAMLSDPAQDGRATFDDLWEERPDRTWRHQRAKADIHRDPTMYFGNQVPLTDELRSRLGLITKFVDQFGTAYRDQFADTYVTIPENGMVILWPGLDWGNDAPSDLDMRKEEYVSVASPAANPNRTTVWTGMFYDIAANVWMVSCETPVDIDGRWVATIGHDILLDELIARAVADHLPGAINVVFRDDGRLISHPDHLEANKKVGGKLPITDLGPGLAELLGIARNTPGVERGVVVAEGDSLLAIHRIAGPGWYFAVKYPKSLVNSAAMEAAQFVFALGVFTLFCELGILFLVLRGKVAGPLTVLMAGADRLASGDLTVEIAVGENDEFGQLASSFNKMTRAIRERDANLAQHAASLEATVAARTADLDQERRRAQIAEGSALQASAAKSQFLANMSHELRTPLNVIIGYAEMVLEMDDVAEEAKGDLRRVLRAARHLLALINDVLDLAKVEAERIDFRAERFHVQRLVDDTVASVHPLIMDRRNQLVVHVAADAGVMDSDILRVRQCLFNLLSNAAKFTEGGTIRLIVDRIDDQLTFAVQDSGMGMSPDQLSRLFQPFTQLDTSPTRAHGGTGLGLALTQRLVRALGGEVSVRSERGSGSTFTLFVPDHLPPDPSADRFGPP